MPKKASFPAFYSPAFLEAATACSGKSPEAGDSTEVLPSKSILPSQRLTVNLSPMKCDAQELSLYWDGKGIFILGMKYQLISKNYKRFTVGAQLVNSAGDGICLHCTGDKTL